MSVREWYAGRSILVTGATGFMGKVLVEKMLRTLPVAKIYVIVRTKRGVSPGQRLQRLLDLPVFQRVKEEAPGALDKLVVITGDVILPGLGLQEADRRELIKQVSVVFHAAATLRLEAELKDSVTHNLIGTKNVLQFCLSIHNLQVVVHLSTAFCHGDVAVLEEGIYPPTRSPDDIISIVNWMDDKALNTITPSILGPHPNTYTFTKRLAETIVYEMGDELPIAIMRPSIVIPAMKEPIAGWVDSLNGPVGVLAGAGKGVIRSMLVDASNHAECIPVDIAVNGLILVAWERANNIFAETPVYNASQADVVAITWGEILERGRVLLHEIPFDWPLWYPDGNIRTSKLEHYLVVFLFQTLPAYFLDFIFFLTRQKTFMVRIQNRIKLGMVLLQYFTLREWKFKTNKFLAIPQKLDAKEKSIFYVNNVEFDVDDYLQKLILGTRQFCMKEGLDSLPRARRYIRFLFVLDRFIKFCFMVSLFWYGLHFCKFIYYKMVHI